MLKIEAIVRHHKLEEIKEALVAQGFHRVVLKNWNSAYAPGRTTDDWLVVEKISGSRD